MPLTYFNSLYIVEKPYGVLAKLVIALACHAGDHGFESRTSRVKALVNWTGAFSYLKKTPDS